MTADDRQIEPSSTGVKSPEHTVHRETGVKTGGYTRAPGQGGAPRHTHTHCSSTDCYSESCDGAEC